MHTTTSEDLHYLTTEKRRILSELETWVLECPEVDFCGSRFDTRDGSVHIVVGGASTRRMSITATAWLTRMQEMLPGVPLKLEIVRGKLKEQGAAPTPQ